jgi:hypothetical protein
MADSEVSVLTRRRVLRLTSLGLGSVSLPRLLWASDQGQAAGLNARADACILVYLNGGPSHLDMWDVKPDAPADIRGEFRPISTSLAGLPYSEHLPRLAKHAHRSALVRAVHHAIGHAHGAAVYTTLTGDDRGDTINVTPTGPNDFPAVGSTAALVRPPDRLAVPFVSLPYITTEGIGGPPQAGFFGGVLGKRYDPLFVTKDPNAADFAVPEITLPPGVGPNRLLQRQSLRDAIDGRFQHSSHQSAGMEGFRQQAFDVLNSEATQRAFQLTRESDPVRDAYGRNVYGQSMLLARRLIEAGTRCVTIAWSPDANATWDTHWDHVNRLKNELLPPLDMAVASLLDDLVERGMLQRTLVVIMGEFGRAPKISLVPGYPLPGRTHWPFCYTVWMAGGGIKPGFLFGASDKIGAFPLDKPVTPADVVATMYHLLGISNNFEFHDPLGRPHRLVPWGEPIEDLFT